MLGWGGSKREDEMEIVQRVKKPSTSLQGEVTYSLERGVAEAVMLGM